jgi:hypothetical protein
MHEHISEKRLREIASDPKANATRREDTHMSRCENCSMRFVALIKQSVQRPKKRHTASSGRTS